MADGKNEITGGRGTEGFSDCRWIENQIEIVCPNNSRIKKLGHIPPKDQKIQATPHRLFGVTVHNPSD